VLEHALRGPDISGITTSVSSRSIRSRRASPSASSGRAASWTSYPALRSIRAAAARTSASSSTRRTEPLPLRSAAQSGSAAAGALGGGYDGRYTSNVDPSPGALRTRTSPRLCFRIPHTVESPSPVPLPASFVVKNGSKRRDRVAASMPVPSSDTEILT